MIFDLWKLGHGEIDLEAFLAEHGYHGPYAGEISSHVWREDPAPVEHLARQYAGMKPDSTPPASPPNGPRPARPPSASCWASCRSGSSRARSWC